MYIEKQVTIKSKSVKGYGKIKLVRLLTAGLTSGYMVDISTIFEETESRIYSRKADALSRYEKEVKKQFGFGGK
jgi:hypothetical protein